MSWQDAHRYNQALRTVEAELNRTADSDIIWRPEFAEIFGSPDRLLLALRSRWETLRQAQVEDIATADGGPAGVERALALAHPGLVRAVSRAAAAQPWPDRAPVAGAA
jgi:hypothetical protein